MATIKDVAQKAGVSIGTVSNVLNHVPTVNETIRKRVQKAIKELNYKPNRIAKSLVSGRTQTLAFIIPDICNPYFPEMVRGATDRASMFGYGLFLASIGNESNREIEYVRHFVSQGVDGLILATSDYSEYHPEEIDEIKALDMPMVMVDREIEGLDRDLVIVDNTLCAYAAVKHLVESGYKRIGIILGPLQTMTARHRLDGGRKALQEGGLFDETLIKSGPFTLEGGFQAMQGLLIGGKEVDAVFCANDMIAIGAIKAIEKEGYRVPEDVAVVGFDDLYLSSLIKPTLTAIHQPTYELGAIAVSMVVDRIQGKATDLPSKVILPGELIVRESSARIPRNRGIETGSD